MSLTIKRIGTGLEALKGLVASADASFSARR